MPLSFIAVLFFVDESSSNETLSPLAVVCIFSPFECIAEYCFNACLASLLLPLNFYYNFGWALCNSFGFLARIFLSFRWWILFCCRVYSYEAAFVAEFVDYAFNSSILENRSVRNINIYIYFHELFPNKGSCMMFYQCH